MNKIFLSSITKKFILALAGLFLLLFLPVHLGINFLLLKSDPEPFNQAAHFMATFPLVKVFELMLMFTFVVHILLGLILQIQNWRARGKGYKVGLKAYSSPFSKFMIYSGAVVFIFLIIHFVNFYFVKLGLVEGDHENFYGMAHDLFAIPMYNYIYWASFLFLGFHLFHAFSSAFQTLGLNHRIWTPVVKVLTWVYALLIPMGFALIPVIIYFFK